MVFLIIENGIPQVRLGDFRFLRKDAKLNGWGVTCVLIEKYLLYVI